MFILKSKHAELLKEISDNKILIGLLEKEVELFKSVLEESTRREETLKQKIESVEKRLKRLLKSEYIRQYDEYDRKTQTYKKDILKVDEEINEFKQKLFVADLNITAYSGCLKSIKRLIEEIKTIACENNFNGDRDIISNTNAILAQIGNFKEV